LAEALEFGISRRYQPETIFSSIIRGKINMRELVALQFKPGSGLVLSHSPLSYDNLFNQAVLYVATEISGLTRSDETRRTLAIAQHFLRRSGVTKTSLQHLLLSKAQISSSKIGNAWLPVRAFVVKYLEDLILDGSLRGENQFYSQLFSLDE